MKQKHFGKMEPSSGQSRCDICGDIGYANAIVTCSKCYKAREHIYCMQSSLCYVPKSWHCEACRCHNMDHHGPERYFEEKVQDSSGRQNKWATEDVPMKIPDTSKTMASPPVSSKVTKRTALKKVEAGKVKFLPAEEVCTRPYRSKPKAFTLQAYSRSKDTNPHPIPMKMSVAVTTKGNQPCKAVGYPQPGKIQTSTLKQQAAELSQPLDHLKSALHIPCKPSTSGSLNTEGVITKRNDRHINDGAYGSPPSHIGPVVVGKIQTSTLKQQATELSQPLKSALHIPCKPSTSGSLKTEAIITKTNSHINDGAYGSRPSRIGPVVVGEIQTSTLKQQATELFQPLDHLKSALDIPCKPSSSGSSNTEGVITKTNNRHINDGAYGSPPSHIGPVVVEKIETSSLKKQATELPQPLDHLKSALDIPCKPSTSGNSNTKGVITKTNNRHINDGAYGSPPSTWPVGRDVKEKYEFEETLPGIEKYAGKGDSLLCYDNPCSKQSANVVDYYDDGVANVKIQLKFGEEDLPNPPAVNPLWKGCFEIHNYPLERYDGFQAHPPGKVSRQAYLFSKLMPQVLQLTLQSRTDVWPETFQTDSPSEFDIALYFWADYFSRFREKYNCLLELMEKEDLSLQSHFDGIKLLIFTSKQLPVKSQRMNKQFYLWGVFFRLEGRHSAVDLKRKHAVEFPLHHYRAGKEPARVTHHVDDMKTDTVVDKEVGILDKCLRSNSITARSCFSDLPPQDVFGRVNSDEPMEKGSVANILYQTEGEQYYNLDAPPGFSRPIEEISLTRPFHQIKREQCEDFDAPPGFAVLVTCNASNDGPILTPQIACNVDSDATDCIGAPPGFSRPIEENFLAGRFHQTKREQCDDFDAPPGFAVLVAGDASSNGPILTPQIACKVDSDATDWVDAPPGFSRPIEETSLAGQFHQIKREQCDDFYAPPGFAVLATGDASNNGPILMPQIACNVDSDATDCVDVPPGFSRPIEETSLAGGFHQTKRERCDDFDVPPGFTVLVTGNASNNEPILAPQIACDLDTPSKKEERRFKRIKREERDSSEKGSRYSHHVSTTSQLSRRGGIIRSSHGLAKSDGSKQNGNEWECFCRICKVPCPGIISLMQHLAGKRHAACVQRIVSEMKSKEEESERQQY